MVPVTKTSCKQRGIHSVLHYFTNLCIAGFPICAFNWHEFQDKCYYYSRKQVFWEKARSTCQDLSADLVIIDSEKEQVSFPCDWHLAQEAPLLLPGMLWLQPTLNLPNQNNKEGSTQKHLLGVTSWKGVVKDQLGEPRITAIPINFTFFSNEIVSFILLKKLGATPEW